MKLNINKFINHPIHSHRFHKIHLIRRLIRFMNIKYFIFINNLDNLNFIDSNLQSLCLELNAKMEVQYLVMN